MTHPSNSPLDASKLLRHDAIRLQRQWERIERVSPNRKSVDLQRWYASLDAATQRYTSRLDTPYTLSYDPELPISRYRDEVIDAIVNRQVTIVCGETGSGKSTQLPKLCLQAGFGKQGWIGHTQPRRLAARSIAYRLAEEMESPFGKVVGYKVRFQDHTESTSLIKLMTDGILLAEIQRDPFLEAYDCIILDEAHERSIQIDLLMAYLARLLPSRPELRIVITSATIDAERFSEHFHDALGPAPILNIEGRSYPVEVRYRGAQNVAMQRVADGGADDSDYDTSLLTRFCDAVDELLGEGRGDILAFFPTEREIRDASKRLRGFLTQRNLHQSVEVLPLYARLTEAEQQRVFQPHRLQRIVLATNVAESSLTVPGIRYVIDTGTARVSRYAAKSRVQRLPIEPVCQASANQRSGRCGRLGPGIAIRLYDEDDFLSRAPFAQPEILRCDLAGTILHAKSLGIADIESIPWLDPPRPESVREGLQTLREIEAIDASSNLTGIGRTLARWPVSPRIGRLLLAASEQGCLNEALVVAAALETQDPRVRPPEFQQDADNAHQKFKDPNSDFLSLMRVWDFYQSLREKLGRSRLEKACRDSFLSLVRLREWGEVHRQLADQCREAKLPISHRRIELSDSTSTQVATGNAPTNGATHARTNASGNAAGHAPNNAPKANGSQRGQGRGKSAQGSNKQLGANHPNSTNPMQRLPKGYAELHQALLVAFPSGVAMQDDRGKYRGASNLELQLWPGSTVKNQPPKWIVSSEIIETRERYARTAARIDPTWIERTLQHCLKFSYDEPHFSRKQGSAMVMRRGTLFGLPAVARHAVPLAPLDPKLARSLLIEHGLAEEQLESRAKFWRENQRFLEDLRKVGEKTRRRDCLADPFVLLEFYRNCVPEHVVDRTTLEKWDRTLTDTKSPPYLSLEQLQLVLDLHQVETEFPDQLEIGAVSRLPLAYHFEPGSEQDGVTLSVPLPAIDQLHHEKLEWLVPGLLREKLQALLKSLPKRLRRQFVPIPDTVEVLLPKMLRAAEQAAPFWKTLCELCTSAIGEPVQKSDFDSRALPEHLKLRIAMHDERGKPIATSRDLAEVQSKAQQQAVKIAEPAGKSGGNKPIEYPWQRTQMTKWDIEDLPRSIIEPIGGVRIERFPTLIPGVANSTQKPNTTASPTSTKPPAATLSGIATGIVDHPHLAEQWLRESVIRLFAQSEQREIKSQIQFLPKWKECSLWLSDRWPGNLLAEIISALMARLALVETDWNRDRSDFQPVPRTLIEWEATRIARVKNIGLAAAELGRWLPKLADAYQQVRKLREQTPKSFGTVLQEIDQQLAALLDPANAYHTPWVYWKDLPRFLLGVASRLEKLKSVGAAKDQQNDQPAAKAWGDYLQRISRLEQLPAYAQKSVRWAPSGSLLEYRWMIEELRVSIHAQKLGTRMSASPKRIEKLQSQLDAERVG